METARFFKQDFEENGSMENVCLFLNLATLIDKEKTRFTLTITKESQMLLPPGNMLCMT